MRILETFGTITKIEEVTTMESSIIPGTLALKLGKAFYGYYSSDPHETVPQTVFLILDKEYTAEEILLAASKIKKYADFDFDALKAEITVGNIAYTSIRLYYVEDYSIVEMLQRYFLKEGLHLKKKVSDVSGIAHIKVKKVFLVDEVADGIYLNRGKSNMGYFEIEKQLNFLQFSEVVKSVRNNSTDLPYTYDAAMGAFYRRESLKPIVRIFDNKVTVERIRDQQKRFNNAIAWLDY